MIAATRRRIHGLMGKILAEHATPPRLALAVGLGCVVGSTPFIGLHFPISVAVAWLLRLNKIAVYAGANISLPPLIPVFGFLSVQLGERMRHGHWLALRMSDFTLTQIRPMAHAFFVDWLVGGIVIGAAAGLIIGPIVYLAARARERRQGEEPIITAMRAATQRYAPLERQYRFYARFKYRLDPCYRRIAQLVPDQSFLVDLGTGLGMLPVLLAELGRLRGAVGIEWDEAKARAGARAAAGLDHVTIVTGDARTAELPSCDVITIVDVLHYYDADVQRALIARCRAALHAGGRLLVRDGDGERHGGARLTRWYERLATKYGWNRGPQVRFRPASEVRADLEAAGFRVEIDEVAGALHPGNVLFVCTC